MTLSLVKAMNVRLGVTRKIYMVRRSVAKAMRVRRGTMKINGQKKSAKMSNGSGRDDG